MKSIQTWYRYRAKNIEQQGVNPWGQALSALRVAGSTYPRKSPAWQLWAKENRELIDKAAGADAQIGQRLLERIQQFIAAKRGHDPLGIFLEVLKQPRAVGLEPEVVIRLLAELHFAVNLGPLAVDLRATVSLGSRRRPSRRSVARSATVTPTLESETFT